MRGHGPARPAAGRQPAASGAGVGATVTAAAASASATAAVRSSADPNRLAARHGTGGVAAAEGAAGVGGVRRGGQRGAEPACRRGADLHVRQRLAILEAARRVPGARRRGACRRRNSGTAAGGRRRGGAAGSLVCGGRLWRAQPGAAGLLAGRKVQCLRGRGPCGGHAVPAPCAVRVIRGWAADAAGRARLVQARGEAGHRTGRLWRAAGALHRAGRRWAAAHRARQDGRGAATGAARQHLRLGGGHP
mmetsp:Transcript_35004/g.89538  ORF Transcript_35004/g.89538 Transcript_35004/m.89538 type:complete len:248 (+) Transcript_35004:396-1139(+)